MPVLARTFEEAGLATVLVTPMPYWVERTGVPRTLAVEYPFGHTLGQPHRRDQQIRVIGEALSLLESARQPGEILHLEEQWPEPQKVAYKDWQPEEPSPIIEQLAPRMREILRQRNNRTV